MRNPGPGPARSAYADLDRPPLSAAGLQAALVRPGSPWTSVQVRPETGSTNADLLRAAAERAPAGAVLIAESQASGRGRLDRTWASPPRAGLTFSVLLRPAAPRRSWGWIPLLTGMALVDAVTDYCGLDVALRWPNDLLAADGRKLAGVLAETAGGPDGDAVVVGVGLNVSTRAQELADLPAATSLALAGARALDRDSLVRAILRALAKRYAGWEAGSGPADPAGCQAAAQASDPAAGAADLAAEYARMCATVGARARVRLPDGSTVVGEAIGVDAQGRLRLDTDAGPRTFAAGDVEHLR